MDEVGKFDMRTRTVKSWFLPLLGLLILLMVYLAFYRELYVTCGRVLSTAYGERSLQCGSPAGQDKPFAASPSSPWLAMEPYARLGNNLYEYAALLSLARRNRRYAFIALGTFEEMIDAFSLTLPVHDVPFLDWPRVWDRMENHTRTYAVTSRLPATNLTLGGSFQSFIHFQDVKDDVRRELTFRRWIREKARRFLSGAVPERWRARTVTTVGVHVRRTDLISDEYTKLGFFFPDRSYFERAMEYFEARYENVLFVVASDDLQFCLEFFSNFSHEIVYSREILPSADLAILSSCNHTIITIGTYGWWIGWLNRGTTVYMQDFPPKRSWAAGIYRKEQYIPPDDEFNHWVGISQDVPPSY